VGQSKNIVVRNNTARDNVAGIEIENSTRADVYGNLAENNTGGVLVFNMPDIPMKGSHTRVYNNDIRGNNLANFAAPGTAVSGVPAGSGVIINSNDNVEIFDNRIGNNATANIVISSYFSANYSGSLKVAPEFDPYPESIYVYGNQFSSGGNKPGFPELDALRVGMFGEDGAFPDILWDGALNPELALEGVLPDGQGICINNGEAVMLNADSLNEAKGAGMDMANHRCDLEKLAAVTLTGLASD
jgi:parallel beta-helix repeat protein